MILRTAKALISKIVNGKDEKARNELEAHIKSVYNKNILQQVVTKSRSIKRHAKASEIVQVKKGKRKYTLLFLQTEQGKIRINLGRHWEGQDKKTVFTELIER